MKDKNGFISMTLLYTFLIIFLFLMLAILSAYTQKNNYLEAINAQINEDLSVSKQSRVTIINRLIEDNSNFYSKNNIYYFNGNINNNNLVFGGFCWKIIRTDEEDSIRLRYNGPFVSNSCNSSNISIASSVYYPQNNSIDYVGYMFGDTSLGVLTPQSSIKAILDKWYEDNLLAYTDSISNAIYCNNRQKTGNDFYKGKNLTIDNITFSCPINDSFTVLDTLDNYGNGLLNYKIALLSVEDVIYAGGSFNNNSNYYLNASNTYWTMSPYSFENNQAKMVVIDSNGKLSSKNVNEPALVIPTISISSKLEVKSGNGTVNNPYIIN